MVRFLWMALALVAGATQAVAQQQRASAPSRTYSQADLWTRTGDRITFNLARISLPTEAGATRFVRSAEGSLEGRGLDNALIYATPDRAVFVTVYIYAPALPDAALTALMTDHVIGLASGPALRRLGTERVGAGGRDGVAIRMNYAGVRQERYASSAAFMRVGRWILKLRVSGPEDRRAEVEATMAALLGGIRIAGETQAAAATPINAAACPPSSGRRARLLPADDAEAAMDAIMAHTPVDRARREAERPMTGWCRSTGYRAPGATGPTLALRDLTPGTGSDTWRRVQAVLIADNGTMFEVVERRFRNRTRYILIHHEIGRTLVLGSYDSVPTDDQLRAIVTGEDREGGRVRASIAYQASGDSNVTVQVAPAAPTT